MNEAQKTEKPEFPDNEANGSFYSLNEPAVLKERVPDDRLREEKPPLIAVYESSGRSGKWPGKLPPPPIGSMVVINFNELGRGKVEGYFVEGGWLGIRVKLAREPQWRKKQKVSGKPALVFAPELKLSYASR